LESWTGELGLEVSAASWERLAQLVALWERYGRAFNLLGDLAPAALVEFVREGLMAVAAVEQVVGPAAAVRWSDVGSGAGLPGLVVGAVRDWELRLIEPRARRASFLELAAAQVVWGRNAVLRGRADASTWNENVLGGEIGPEGTDYRVASAKAVFAPGDWLDLAVPRVGPRGLVVAHVGKDDAQVGERVPIASVTHGSRRVAVFRAELGPNEGA
jgi:16S rRNA (guanine527-N7)-methyltransferase